MAGSETVDHLAQLESQFVKLMVMRSEVEEAIKAEILLSSLMGQDKYGPIIASINTVLKSMAISSYVTNIF